MTSHEPRPPEEFSFNGAEDLELTEAQLVSELFAVSHHPAVRAVRGLEADVDAHLGIVAQYTSHSTIIELFSEGVRGELKDQDVMEHARLQGGDHAFGPSLGAADGFLGMFHIFAAGLGFTNREMASKIIAGGSDNLRLLTMITNEICHLYRDGLMGEDGRTDNMAITANMLRFFNTTLLFQKSFTTNKGSHRFYRSMYERATGSPLDHSGLNSLAQKYADEYQLPVVRAARIRRVRRQAMSDVNEVTNRAALLSLMYDSVRWLDHVQDHEYTKQAHERVLRAAGRADDLPALHERIEAALTALERRHQGIDESSMPSGETFEKALEVEWEFLPPGELETHARSIMESRAPNGTERVIDRQRLRILHNVREQWGPDRSFYAHCRLGKRGMVRKGNEEEPDQYVMLILQEHDAHGNVLREHAVAESPIAGPNALYVFR